MTDTQRQLLPREERRAQILRAAARAFADGGFAATSMEEVAAAAGVTKLIVYRHFESKEELYGAVLDSVSARMAAEWAAAVADPEAGRGAGGGRQEAGRGAGGGRQEAGRGAGGGRQEEAVRAFLRVAREDPHGYRLLVFHAPREPQFEKQAFGYWETAVEGTDALIGAQVRPPVIRRWVVRMLMSYLLHSVLIWIETGEPADDDTFVASATDGLEALVRTWTDQPGPR